MSHCVIDHITVTAPSLATGAEFVRSDMGVFLLKAEGNIEPMSRGPLDWLIAIPADGSLPLGGAAPGLIEWHTDVHRAQKLEDQGLSLVKLELFCPEPERLTNLLQSLKLDAPVSVLAGPISRLVAHIDTPQGLRLLSTANGLVASHSSQLTY